MVRLLKKNNTCGEFMSAIRPQTGPSVYFYSSSVHGVLLQSQFLSDVHVTTRTFYYCAKMI